MIDFSDIPNELKDKIHNYGMNLVEIRKLQDTEVFRTDIGPVFDFIRFSKDKYRLKNLIETNPYYQHMEEETMVRIMERFSISEEKARAFIK